MSKPKEKEVEQNPDEIDTDDEIQEALAEKLGKSIGFAMGIDFRQSALLIATKSTQVAKKGMIFLTSTARVSTALTSTKRDHDTG